MTGIHHSKFSWTKEGHVVKGVGEASSLGLAPGHWPGTLFVQGKRGLEMFHDDTLPHPASIRQAADRGYRTYTSHTFGGTCVLTVFND